LYLDEYGRPDLAIACYKDYRDSQRSGADTIYRLAQAYEAAGDIPNAKRCYKLVMGYASHPRYWDASSALRRLDESPQDAPDV
jgi:predicted Zn-dependent protease